jgi:hypothetical protein
MNKRTSQEGWLAPAVGLVRGQAPLPDLFIPMVRSHLCILIRGLLKCGASLAMRPRSGRPAHSRKSLETLRLLIHLDGDCL